MRFVICAAVAGTAAYVIVSHYAEPAEWQWAPARPAEADDAPSSCLEEGRFALGGFAAEPGHSVVTGVTFRRRLPGGVTAEQIEVVVEARDNVADAGPTVLAAPGFAPDRDGFTLLLAADGPGPFSAGGTYRVHASGRIASPML